MSGIRTVPTAAHWGSYLARTDGSRLLDLAPFPATPFRTGSAMVSATRCAHRAG